MLADSSARHEVVAGDTNIEQNTEAAPAGSTKEPSSTASPRNRALLKACQTHFDVKFLTSFFGCYWRNRNQNLLGFPFVRGQTLDYAECFKQDNFHNKPSDSDSFSERVRLMVQTPDGYDKSRICLTARIIPVSTIDPDESLIGRTVRLSELDQILSAQAKNPKDGEVIVNMRCDGVENAATLVKATAVHLPGSSPSNSPLDGDDVVEDAGRRQAEKIMSACQKT